eukprot:1104283-Pyramimonas_sp.AAC.1
MSTAVSATAAASIAPDYLAALRASMARWRGRTDAPASAKQRSQSPPHGFCKPNSGWVAGMIAREWK